MIRIWGDSNQADAIGRIILTHADDVKSEKVELREGMLVIVWDGDEEAEGILEFEDGRWRARIVQASYRQRHRNAWE